MTGRREDLPLEKVTLNLYQGDWERLAHFHGDQNVSRAIRLLVRRHIQRVERQLEA